MSPICSHCKKPSHSEYADLGNEILCPSCWEKHFQGCRICGKKLTMSEAAFFMTDPSSGQGEAYCKKCVSSLTCQGCRRKIYAHSSAIIFGGTSGKPLAYCHSCVSKMSCYGCGQSLDSGVHHLQTSSGKQAFYCAECAQHPPCRVCSLPVPVTREVYEGENYCPECFTKVLKYSDPRLNECWDRVVAFFKKSYGFSCRSPLPIMLSKDKLSEVIGSRVESELGFYNVSYVQERGLLSSKTRFVKCQIYLLCGLTPEQTEEVLAHEICHDLVAFHLPQFRNKLYEEGFCQYVASEYNLSKGRARMNIALFKNPDPIYGEGARIIRSWAPGCGGVQGILQKLKTLR